MMITLAIISPLAIIDPRAIIGPTDTIGPNSICIGHILILLYM